MTLIPHSKPTISQADVQAVEKTMASGMIAQGAAVREFEAAVASFLNVQGGVAVNSGTAALHLALLALDIGPGDEVILPSYVCTAPLNAIGYTGATPVLSDINPESGNIAPASVKEVISKRTKAIIVPHMMGRVADLEGLSRFGVPLIEDCAQAIGARFKGQPVGSYGHITVCSFYATKVMTSGEGGMVLSNDQGVIERLRDLRDYDEKSHYRIRYNYKLTDMQASLGLSQLGKLPEFITARKQIADFYDASFSSFYDCSVSELFGAESIDFRYVLRLPTDDSAFIGKMAAENVVCRRPVFQPLHKLIGEHGFEHTEALHRSAVSLPIYPKLSKHEQIKIVGCVQKTLGWRP